VYIAEKAAEFGIDLTEVNGSASSSAAVAETAEAAVAETAVAENFGGQRTLSGPAGTADGVGLLDFTGWQGRGSGAGKKTVGMEVSKTNIEAELAAWGYCFVRGTKEKPVAPINVLVEQLLELTGTSRFRRKSNEDGLGRGPVWCAVATAVPPNCGGAATPALSTTSVSGMQTVEV